MDEQETLEAILALVGLSLFCCIATIGTMLASMDADSFLYIEFNPEEDFFVIMGSIIINCVFQFYYLSQSSKFRKSKNLNYRIGEILYISDKMKFYSLFFIPIQAVIFYFLLKYNQTSITLYLALLFLLGLTLILLIFFNSFRIKRDVREEIAEK